MPSSFMVKRNYAHCPLKKRPLALYNEPATSPPEQDQPEDLSVKRPRLESPAEASTVCPPATAPLWPSSPSLPTTAVPTVLHTVPRHTPSSPPAARVAESLPSLAEYYLQLFKSTSDVVEPRRVETRPSLPQWTTPYLPPSPQASPVTSEHLAVSPVPFHCYPDTSALISPVSTCSSTASESEDDVGVPRQRREARYSCSDCSKSYSTYSGLSKHKQFHCAALGAKSFACKHCDKVYTSLGALKMHIRTHTLPCKCQLCGKAFSRPWLLQGHIRTHTGEKPFQCSQCDRCFADRSNLRAHLQTHADVKKYACVTCHKTFSRMSLLNKHTEAACPARPHHQEQPQEQPPEADQ
ncbi:protein snail homolog Sna-like [Homarus americanus]|uniref:Zinc finger protein SNAI2-like 2 n=1 Tax=Homarus americanus TaxID=6706 RepID=A0A8J5MV23_HOMAM|nr:protein snail homolog Sna-like [Homarus americanus]KAG7164407.1 Zinc finger protein SNAI2-like 2 [Homarus americanus]